MAKSTGGGGSFVLNSVTIGFNTISPSIKREMDDASDSINFDVGTAIVHLSQLPVSTQTTFEIEGKIDLAVVPTSIVALLYTGQTALPAVFKYNSTATYGHGNVDITDFKGTIDPMKVLTFTATMITNGVFVPNA